MIIGSNLAYFAQSTPNKPALYYKNDIITYQDFREQVETYKAQLRSLMPDEKGIKVGIYLDNEPRFLFLFFAIISLGWIAVPIDPKTKETEMLHIVKDINPYIIITTICFFRQEKEVPSPFFTVETLEEQPNISQTHHYRVFKEDSFFIGLTSGSTGTPKGYIRNHNSWLTSFAAGEYAFKYGGNDIIMAPGPLSHSLSLFGAVHALHIGASFYLMGKYSASQTYQLINERKITVLYAVPTMLYNLTNIEKRSEEAVLFLSSGATLDNNTKKRLKERFPQSMIYEYYGASEMSYITYANEEIKASYPTSVGKPFPGVKIKICDKDFNELPPNVIGSVFVESEFTFDAYVNNREATNQVITTEGVTIGDLGYLNDAGLLTIVGRSSNMLIVGGQNVYPEEIEQVLKSSSNVKEAIIIGKDHMRWGKQLIAFIQFEEGKEINTKQLKDICKLKLPIYKRPRRYLIVESFPYTKTGKVSRFEIESNLLGWMK